MLGLQPLRDLMSHQYPLHSVLRIGATGVSLNSNIIITFNGTVAKGTGNITLRENSAGGTAFSTIGVSSSSVTISGGAVTIDPPSNIGSATTTFVVVDAGAFLD
jgi:large repetitive protein